MKKVAELFSNLTEEQKEAFHSFRNILMTRNSETESYNISIEAENPKFIYVDKDRAGISDEEKNRLSFFPEYLAGKYTVITNTGLIYFIEDYSDPVETLTVTTYDLLAKDDINLNEIDFDKKTMFITEENNPGYDEYNTPLSYFKIAYGSPSNSGEIIFPINKQEKKYIVGNNMYISFPVDKINNITPDDRGLFVVSNTLTNMNSLMYKYNQIFMFKSQEDLNIKVYGIELSSNTGTILRKDELNSSLLKITKTGQYAIYVDVSNYLPSKYKYFEFVFTRDKDADELDVSKRFLEVLC